ncbi:MarR family winged helix-turn-helix transcriptional regulator [Nonomuraea soli]|uniref:DNA-binding MarR family transcriptional regulator n=1 Tax=Nonomuraea soli TaxID=1032476 RepID=A0A7W0CVB4_9ACTN|nr:MarR family transcriptional regulator [Nonomuraea soli]MBA2897897.1 DNA-binding MarR family transcriptional regulator [Nonomuraea soli]
MPHAFHDPAASLTTDLRLEDAGCAFIGVWCRSQDKVAGHVPPSQLHTLETIASRPDISLRDLAEQIGSTSSSASRLCDRLVAAGLLTRSADDNDRRRVALRATAAGDQLIRDLIRQRRLDLQQVMDKMTATERDQLTRGLAAFAAASQK